MAALEVEMKSDTATILPKPAATATSKLALFNALLSAMQLLAIFLCGYWVISSNPLSVAKSSALDSASVLLERGSSSPLHTNSVPVVHRSSLVHMMGDGDIIALNGMEHLVLMGPPAGAKHMYKVLGYSWYNTSLMDVYLSMGTTARVTPGGVKLLRTKERDLEGRRLSEGEANWSYEQRVTNGEYHHHTTYEGTVNYDDGNPDDEGNYDPSKHAIYYQHACNWLDSSCQARRQGAEQNAADGSLDYLVSPPNPPGPDAFFNLETGKWEPVSSLDGGEPAPPSPAPSNEDTYDEPWTQADGR